MAENKLKIKESTLKRCEIIRLSGKNLPEYMPIKLNYFRVIKRAETISFPIYFLIGWDLIEYIRPREWSPQLFEEIYKAATKGAASGNKICIRKQDLPRYEHALQEIKTGVFKKLREKDFTLDPRVLEQFGRISAASQAVVRGALDNEAAYRVVRAASDLVEGGLEGAAIVKTLTGMITLAPALYDHESITAMLAYAIAGTLTTALAKRDCKLLVQAALFHDIDYHCANNSQPLLHSNKDKGREEMESVMKAGAPIHPTSIRVTREIHENMDGSGSFGLCGCEEMTRDSGIHILARINKIACKYAKIIQSVNSENPQQPSDIFANLKDNFPGIFDEGILGTAAAELS